MLTRRAKYGLKAMIYLARSEQAACVQAEDIAAANRIPQSYLHMILRDLRTRGMVISKKGPGGGYSLPSHALQIRVGDVIRFLDGPMAPLVCAVPGYKDCCPDCKDVRSCRVRLAMMMVNDATNSVMDSLTLADMVNLPPEAA